MAYYGDKFYFGFDTSGTGTYSGKTTITSANKAYPTLTVTAVSTATLNYVENATTKQTIWINNYTMQPGETVTFDFSKATATSSVNGNILWAIAPGSDMRLRLEMGNNNLLFFAPSGTVTTQLSWNPQYETLAEALQ
jgi:hypothetical protein